MLQWLWGPLESVSSARGSFLLPGLRIFNLPISCDSNVNNPYISSFYYCCACWYYIHGAWIHLNPKVQQDPNVVVFWHQMFLWMLGNWQIIFLHNDKCINLATLSCLTGSLSVQSLNIHRWGVTYCCSIFFLADLTFTVYTNSLNFSFLGV